MTLLEAAGIMMNATGSTASVSFNDIVELPKPDVVEYSDDTTGNGLITEHYNVGKDNAYNLYVNVSFSNKGTPNEQVTSLTFLDSNHQQTGYVSFSGFYVG